MQCPYCECGLRVRILIDRIEPEIRTGVRVKSPKPALRVGQTTAMEEISASVPLSAIARALNERLPNATSSQLPLLQGWLDGVRQS